MLNPCPPTFRKVRLAVPFPLTVNAAIVGFTVLPLKHPFSASTITQPVKLPDNDTWSVMLNVVSDGLLGSRNGEPDIWIPPPNSHKGTFDPLRVPVMGVGIPELVSSSDGSQLLPPGANPKQRFGVPTIPTRTAPGPEKENTFVV
jgi:hypothetical protein